MLIENELLSKQEVAIMRYRRCIKELSEYNMIVDVIEELWKINEDVMKIDYSDIKQIKSDKYIRDVAISNSLIFHELNNLLSACKKVEYRGHIVALANIVRLIESLTMPMLMHKSKKLKKESDV